MQRNTSAKRRVEAELEWEPSVDARGIGVAMSEGVVTLTGHVPTYLDKLKAEQVVKRVRGVKGVANDLVVQPDTTLTHTDTDLAQAAVRALEWDVVVPHDRIQVHVEDGSVRLEGGVEWQYQKSAAENALRGLLGVRGIYNAIKVKPRVMPADVKLRIQDALKRSAEVEARGIQVEARDGTVVLKGKVRTWTEREAAEAAAWAAPGVIAVEDRLAIDAPWRGRPVGELMRR